MAKVLWIFIFIGLAGCASSNPRYKNIWVHSELDKEERSLAWDICSLEADQAKTNYLVQTPQDNPYSSAGALNNYARQAKSNKTRDTAFRVCMRSAGFKFEKRCVSNCNNDS